jgi:predicted DNA-binding antitoxin AbrB/MazE fold protein
MIKVIEAVYDGSVLRPQTDIELAPNTRVRLTVEFDDPQTPKKSFLETARSLKLTGPVDWSENLDHYLYGDDTSTS